MEITTIIGIVIAVIICLIGLRMMLRKSNDAAPSLDSALHIHPESNQPVIPRHVRDQLRTETVEESRVEPNLNALDAVEVKEEQVDLKVNDSLTIETDVISDVKEQKEDLNSADVSQIQPATNQNAESIVEPISTLNTESDLVIDKVPDSKKGISETIEETKAIEEVEAFSPNTQVEAAKIQEFEDESSILDVHLHEQQRQDDQSILANAESIIALNVYPNPRRALSGDKTLKVLLKYGLRFGEMSCFHRYEDPENESSLMFSVLRITDEGPAGFDLEALSIEQVQGLAFFLALPHPDVQKGFDTMVSIAGLIARETDGTVYDENNLEFTPQLKEHWRHKAIDYRSGQEV